MLHVPRNLVTIAVRVFVVLILVFAPWAFGSTEPWAQTTIQSLTGLILVCVILEASLGFERRSWDLLWSWWWGAPLLALVIYTALQALNPSHYYQLASQSLLPRTCINWLPYSADASITWGTLRMLMAYAVLFWGVAWCFKGVVEVKVLLMILAVSGFALALVAILQSVSGEQKLLWFRKSPIPEFMGSFVNRNNYAAYMNLLIPVTLALGCYVGEMKPDARSKGHAGYLFYFMAAVMTASVLRSGSRAGLMICVLLLACWLWNLIFAGERMVHGGRRRLFLSVSIVILAAAGLLLFSGVEPLAERFAAPANMEEAQMRENSNTRPIAYRATFEMFRDHWLYGIGAGTFPRVFPYYQPASLAGFWPYAHCDWLQYIAELGVVGFALLAGVMFGILRRCAHNCLSIRECQDAHAETRIFRRHVLPALGFSLAGVALHACVDFPLHIPGVATLAAAYLALVYHTA